MDDRGPSLLDQYPAAIVAECSSPSRPSVTREAEEEEGGAPVAIVMLDCWATDTKETPNRYGQRLSYRRQYHG
jgi:hypothetical protein